MGVKERRALEKQMRRNKILDAARKLLFSQGFENVSISKISKEAQLGVGTIYNIIREGVEERFFLEV